MVTLAKTKVTRRKGGKVSWCRHRKRICPLFKSQKPKAKSQKRDASDVVEQIHWLWRRSLTFPPLRRVTFWQTPQKVTKKGWLLSYGPYAALRGSLAPALLPGGPRPRPIHGPKRLTGILPVTSLRKTSTRPPEVAICVVWTFAYRKQDQKPQPQPKPKPSQSQACVFALQLIDFAWAIRLRDCAPCNAGIDFAHRSP